jgi:hypothetical protein
MLRRHRPLRLDPGEQAGATRHILAADLEHVLEAGGGDERGGAPLPSRIRLVATVVPCSTRATVAAREPDALQDLGDAIAEAARGVVGRRGVFGGSDAARRRIEQRDVGERAAGVDADDHGASALVSRPSASTSLVAVAVEELRSRGRGARVAAAPTRRAIARLSTHAVVLLRACRG